MIYYFDSKNPKAPAQMGRLLTDMVTQKILPHQEIVILCIGSDRSTGDSLGPIIGHQFRNFISPGIYLLGDLNQPVHADKICNMETELEKKKVEYDELDDLVKKQRIYISSNYEAYLGKEFINVDKLSELNSIMKSDSADTIAQALAVYNNRH